MTFLHYVDKRMKSVFKFQITLTIKLLWRWSITQGCLSWSALSLSLPPVLTLAPPLGVPSPPRLSIKQSMQTLPHPPARYSHQGPWLVPLIESITHARPLVVHRQDWPLSGLWLLKGRDHILVPSVSPAAHMGLARAWHSPDTKRAIARISWGGEWWMNEFALIGKDKR